jgi:hypothetical protein
VQTIPTSTFASPSRREMLTKTDNEESADQDGDAGVEIEVEDENGEI